MPLLVTLDALLSANGVLFAYGDCNIDDVQWLNECADIVAEVGWLRGRGAFEDMFVLF
jgi:hypothetical protein